MKKLIYFTLGNNAQYIDLAELCIKSLYKQNYTGDFLFIIDSSLKAELLTRIDFTKLPYFLDAPPSTLLHSSSNKLKIYDFPHIEAYDKIIFSDLDIIWTSPPDIIFNLIQENQFYFSNEGELMSVDLWGGNLLDNSEKDIINSNNIKGLNAGIFAFPQSMVQHMRHIDDFFQKNIHLVNVCLEQPYLNTYVFRHQLYNNALNSYVSHKGYNFTTPYEGVALHFAGGPGNYPIKYNTMLNYYNNFL